MPTLTQARAWYPGDDATHGFDHIQRVYTMAERLAAAEGADLEIVRAAALLHDAIPPADEAGPDLPGGRETHHHASASFARHVLAAEGWNDGRITAVEHAIRAHRFRDGREPPVTLEAQVLFDADKLDAIGALGVARAVAYSSAYGLPFYARPSAAFIETGQTEPGEPHTAYHEYLFKLRHLSGRLYTPAARRMGAERHRLMAEFFERLALEAEGKDR
jgi:uncharacterized protein